MTSARTGVRPARRVLWLLFVAAPLAAASCEAGPKLYAVHGQVFYEGQPASGAVVVFHPQRDHPPDADSPDPAAMSDMPCGMVGPDGSFELTTYKQGRGAAPGRYVVTVSWPRPSAGSDAEDQELLPPRYLHPATSGLAVEVKEGDNKLPPIRLTR